MIKNKLNLLGYASSVGGVDIRGGEGPLVLQRSPYFSKLKDAKIYPEWQAMIGNDVSSAGNENEIIQKNCEQLAKEVFTLTKDKKYFNVIGGDHTCAIGTWSGVATALRDQGDIGLIWIDAHMDSHTPQTSLSGRLHGMPLACLLGFGDSKLISIGDAKPKLKPEHICLIGVRSFESGEAELLKKLNVRIFLMEEVKIRGISEIMREAKSIVSQGTVGFGVSLDLDAIDPAEAPGVDVPEPDGIHAADLQMALKEIASDPKLLGCEIVEFDPSKDKDQITEKLVVSLILTLMEK